MTATVLDDARAAFSQRRWEDAFALLLQGDAQVPLSSDDLALLSRAAAMTGRDDAAFVALERAYELCLAQRHHAGACRAAFWHGFRLASLGEEARAAAWLARAEDLLPELGAECPERGYLFLPRIHRKLRHGEFGVAAELAQSATKLADACRDDDLSALGRQLHGRALLNLGDIGNGMKLLDQAMLIATGRSCSELVKGLVYCSVIAGCQQVFALGRAREWTEVLSQWCDAQPQLGIFTGSCRVHRAEILQITGAWEGALDELRHLGEAQSNRLDHAAAAYQQAEILRLRGEYAAARAAYEQANDHGAQIQPGLALLLLAQGQADAAAGALRRVLGTTSDPLQRARFLPAHVEIMLRIGAFEEADAAANELSETARRFDMPMLHAVAAHAGGEIALATDEADRALPLLQRAFEIWQELDAPFLAARIRVTIANVYEALGDKEGARLARSAARKVFAKLRAHPDLHHLDQAERRAREAPAGGLTAREVEVLKLAASGNTNKAIASRLGLSDRTVDRHISNILTKLDVPSRAAATSYAYQHGLL